MDEIRKKLTELGPCARCKRPTFRERVPIVTLLRRYGANRESLQNALRHMNMGVASEFPVALAENFWPMNVTLSQSEQFPDLVLCMRCSVALSVFLEELSEEEVRAMDGIDQFNAELKAKHGGVP